MNNCDFFVSDLKAIRYASLNSVEAIFLCGSDDDCGCEGGEGSCECGYDPECE